MPKCIAFYRRKINQRCYKSSLLTARHGCLPMPLWAESEYRASYTVEAAVIMPLYACFIVAILLFFRIFSVCWSMEVAMHEVAEEVAYAGEEVEPILMESAVLAKVAMDKKVTSYVRHGLLGLDFGQTKVTNRDVDLRVSYVVEVPVGLLGPLRISVTQRAKHRRWLGYDPCEDSLDTGEYVYVTKYGTAYHNRIGCPYLRPSVHEISGESVGKTRNADGHRYRACSYCHPKKRGTVYITDYGETYHRKRNCMGIKRSVQRIRIEEAKGYHPCGKCYGKKE